MHIFLVVALISGAASAHSGDRVYPFYELTDEMLEKIDIHDGLIDEWYEIGEPSMTMLDFKTFGDSVPLDPSNLDARIWLAWHDESNRIYAALVVADDKYYNAHNHNAEGPPQQHMDIYDSAAFYIDGDHSGGGGDAGIGDEAEVVSLHGKTQRYNVIAETVSGPTLDNYIRGNQGGYTGEPSSWKVHPPYGDAGGAAAGEQPAVSVIEMYVTPYDWWGAWDDIDQTGFSELSANQIVGFAIVITDQDRRYCDGDLCISKDWYPADIELYVPEPWGVFLAAADLFVDGLLLPARNTAVESMTWGRIKASLQP